MIESIEEAKARLDRPLRFGDPEQIEAVTYLAQWEQAKEAIARCRTAGHAHAEGECTNCDGEGRCQCLNCRHVHDCGECEGTGWEDGGGEDGPLGECPFVKGINREILRQVAMEKEIVVLVEQP